jgi:hypothetical protein
VRLYTDVNRNRFSRVKFSDAKRAVDVWITMDDSLVEESRQGMPYECVLAKGIMRAVGANTNLFPHKVWHAHVLPRSIYLVDRVDGQATHAIRYQHDFAHLTYAFDSITKQEFIKQFGKGGFKFRLRTVKKRGGVELPGARETRRKGGAGDPNVSNRVSRGAYGRAVRAGFAIPESP